MRDWVVFASPLRGHIGVCDDRPVFRQETDTTAAHPSFPPSLGGFEAEGFRCEYKGDEDRLGLLECEGVEHMWCEAMPSWPVTACGMSSDPVVVAVVICRW